MIKFEKGHWNIDELEIQEWIEPKQKGFQRIDVESLKEKLIENIAELNFEKESTNRIFKILDKRFGF